MPNEGVLAASTTKKVFDQKCSGATDISAKSTQKCDFYVYTSWLKYKKNKPYKTYKKVNNIKLTCNLSNTNHYYIKIVSKNKFNATCNISQHIETKTVRNKGIKWIANGKSAVPGGTIIVKEKLYFSKYEVSEALENIDNNTVLDTQTTILNLTWFVGTSAIMGYNKSKFVAGLFSAISGVQVFKGIDFKKITKKQIRDITGYTYKNHKGTAKKGVMIKIYYCQGMEMVSIQSWDGVHVSGEKGYMGRWSY